MLHTKTTTALLLAGVLMAAGWQLAAPSGQPTGTPSAASFPTPAALSARVFGELDATASSDQARTSEALQSPFGSSRSAGLEPVQEPPRKQFEQLLRSYRVTGLPEDEKKLIEKQLRDFLHDPKARAFILDTFFSADEPQLTESLYGLILDARLKDVPLIEDLIRRDSTPSDSAFKTRIVDLIADLGTKKDAPYSSIIDGYLAQASLSPDEALRNAAASRRIWYVAQHQSDNLASLQKYILDTAPTVREEMYGLIESRAASQTLAGQAELATALNSALHSDHLGVTAEERTRVATLLANLAHP